MRFFLEFVSCWGPSAQRPAVQTTASSAEEERSLVPPSSGTRRRKKRGRLGTSSAPEWSPSLGSISEDHIVPLRERGDARNGKVGSEREVKRRSSAAPAAAATVYRRKSSDDYRLAAAPTIAAFSPTPFMF